MPMAKVIVAIGLVSLICAAVFALVTGNPVATTVSLGLFALEHLLVCIKALAKRERNAATIG